MVQGVPRQEGLTTARRLRRLRVREPRRREKYKEFRELTDEISYRVVEFDGWFFVIGSLSDPDPDGD